MITCRKCAKENQDHYKFCLGCGAELPRETGPKPFSAQTPPHGVNAVSATAPPAAPVINVVPAAITQSCNGGYGIGRLSATSRSGSDRRGLRPAGAFGGCSLRHLHLVQLTLLQRASTVRSAAMPIRARIVSAPRVATI